MAFPSSTLGRRARRRRRLVIATLIAVLLGMLALAIRYRTEERDISAYLALAQDVANDQVQLSADLSDLIVGLGESERYDVLERLQTLEERAAQLHDEIEEAAVARPIAEAHGFLMVATASWSDALAGLDDAFIKILDEPDDPNGDAILVNSFQLLRIGDRAYAGFRAAVDEMDGDVLATDYPELAYVGRQRENLYEAATIGDRLRIIRGLAESHDISVTASIEPTPVSSSGTFPVVPFANSVDVQVVVGNEGNLPEESILVTLTLSAAGRSGEGASLSETIDILEPGQATTADFTSISVEPGGLYELVVATDVVEDADPENNQFSTVFFVNDSDQEPAG
jgi:hypothetical protein